MSATMWVRSHVERLLQDEWAVCRVTADDEGDYPFRRGTAAGWVSLLETEQLPFVHVFAFAVTDIKSTAALLRELNDIQRHATTASVMWSDKRVVVCQTISPIGLTQPVLAQAVHAVGAVADDIGLLIAGMYGGSTPYPADQLAPTGDDSA